MTTISTVDLPATLTAAATFVVAVATLVKAFRNGRKTDAVHQDVKAVKANTRPAIVTEHAPPTVPTRPTDPGV